MRYSALIGNPTKHSVSPLLFEWIASHLTQPIEYRHLKIDIPHSSDLKAALKSFQELAFKGINVTLPYKQDVIQYLDEVDNSISSIGAVNTVIFDRKKKKSIGYNTDWYGIYRPLSTVVGDTQKNEAIIFGTGGAARAAIYACLELQVCQITVLHQESESNRTRSLQSQFSNRTSVDFALYENIAQYIDTTDIIINATSTGMIGRNAATPFDLELLSDNTEFSNKVFFDCVFNPIDTPLLSYFRTNGADTVDGLWMMIYQGLYAFMLWTSIDVRCKFTPSELNELHRLLQDRIEYV